MNDESKGALNVRDFPKDLIRRCKIAALDKKPKQQTLGQFVEDALRAALGEKPTKRS
jgi:hypothetical protein